SREDQQRTQSQRRSDREARAHSHRPQQENCGAERRHHHLPRGEEAADARHSPTDPTATRRDPHTRPDAATPQFPPPSRPAATVSTHHTSSCKLAVPAHEASAKPGGFSRLHAYLRSYSFPRKIPVN